MPDAPGRVRKFDASPREASLENWFRLTVKSCGGKAQKFITPGERSAPDRICFFSNRHMFFVELKRQGQKATPKQLIAHEWYRSMGWNVYVADSKEACLQILRDEGVYAL